MVYIVIDHLVPLFYNTLYLTGYNHQSILPDIIILILFDDMFLECFIRNLTSDGIEDGIEDGIKATIELLL